MAELKRKTSLRYSYAQKILRGEKTAYRPKPKPRTAYKPKHAKPRSQLFSIFTDDLNQCYVTGDVRNVHLHHIFGGSNKANSEQYGFLVPLRADWHDMSDYGIHFDPEMNLQYKRKCQEYWLNHYGTKKEFIAKFKKWW